MPVPGMGKLRSDSTWAALTLEQRETLEGWLFEDNQGYAEVLAQAEKEFGVTGSKMSLSRFYQRTAAERAQREFLDLETTVKEINSMEVDWREMGSAAMVLIAKRLLQISLQSPDKVKEMAWLGRIVVDNEAQNIRRGWLKMAREKFELDVAAEFLARRTETFGMSEEDMLREDEHVLKIRQALFGSNLPQ